MGRAERASAGAEAGARPLDERLDRELDEAVEQTFPASDPTFFQSPCVPGCPLPASLDEDREASAERR